MSASLARPLARLRRLGGPDGPTIGEISQALAGPSILPLLVLAAMLGMIPSPGVPLGSLAGAAVVWLALAMLRGTAAPLPQSLVGKRIPRNLLNAALRRLTPLLRKLERPARKRWEWAAAPGPAAAMVLFLGLLIVLPAPFGNVLPGAAIIVLSIALARQDGRAALLGYALGAAGTAFITLPVAAFIAWVV